MARLKNNFMGVPLINFSNEFLTDLPKGNKTNYFRIFADVLKKQEMSNKAVFLLGDFNLNALDYDTNEVVKNFFNLIFQNGFVALIQRLTSY